MDLLRRRDFYAGGLICLAGLGAMLEARAYTVGSLTRMGPGFFPMALGVVLVVVGLLIAAVRAAAPTGLAGETAEPAADGFDLRGGGCILLGVLAFILLGDHAGLVPATFVCVFVSALGDRESVPKSAAMLAAVVTVFGSLLFSFVLKIGMPLFAWWPS